MFKINKFIVLMWLLAFSQLSVSASFDCNKAATLVEQTICTNKQLSELDTLVATRYKNALNSSPDKNSVKARQRDWLFLERNSCQDIVCLKAAYNSRLAELNQSNGGLVLLTTDNGEVTVPENQKWIIQSFKPYVSDASERNIGTADISFIGSVLVEGKYNISGSFQITMGSGASSPIVVYGGTKISVGDSRGEVAIKKLPAY